MPTPMTFDQLHTHLLSRYEPLIKSTARRYKGEVPNEDVRQVASITAWKCFEKGDLVEHCPVNGETRVLDLSGMEALFAKTFPLRVQDEATRSYATIRVPHKKRTLFYKIEKEAKRQQVHPRDLCESMGMTTAEFDRVSYATAEQFNLDTNEEDGYETFDRADYMLQYTDETWDDVVQALNTSWASFAREHLTRDEDLLIEILYWELPQRDSDLDHALPVYNQHIKPERVTRVFLEALHTSAMSKMRTALYGTEEWVGWIE